MERRSSVNSPLRLFSVSGQFRLHFKQKVKWFATELVKSGYLRKVNFFYLRKGKFFLGSMLLYTSGKNICTVNICEV